jgi:hypothetical protein
MTGDAAMKMTGGGIAWVLALASGAATVPISHPPESETAFAHAVLTSIISEDSKGFLAMASPSGISFGTDGAIISHEALKRDFTRRSATYCILFRCRRQAELKLIISALDINKPRVTHDKFGASLGYYRKGRVNSGIADLTVGVERRGSKFYVVSVEYI